MTTFTSSDRENAAKLVEEAPYHPGYEDAVVYPTVIVDSGASVDDREDSMQMLRDQIHTQNCEIKALRMALVYANAESRESEGDFKSMSRKDLLDYIEYLRGCIPKELTEDDIYPLIAELTESPTNDELYRFADKLLRKAQEK